MLHGHNSGYTLMIFKFSAIRKAKRFIKMILIVFLKKNLIQSNWGILGSKITHNSGSALSIFLKFCTMKGTKRCMGIIIFFFFKKILCGHWAIFSPEMMHSHNSGFAQTILFFCKMNNFAE